MDQYTVLHSPFDIDVHQRTFTHYLEVILRADGTIEYAVPSHQEKLIEIACNKLSVTREELYRMCPPEYYLDVITWLTKETECIAVWDNYYMGHPNELQLESLYKLQEAGLYTPANENFRKNL